MFSNLLSVAVMHAGNDISVTYYTLKACAIKGSTASLFCRVKPAGHKVIWVVGSQSVDLKEDLRYSGRVKYSYDYKWMTYLVEISNVRESDSAEYQCKVTTPDVKSTGSPGISLAVTGDMRYLPSSF